MVRLLTVNDLDEFIRVRLQGLKLNPEAFGASYEDGLDRELAKKQLEEKDEENFILGCFDGSKLVGMIVFMRKQRRKLKHKGSIFGMFVDRDYRGKGLGKLLLRKCIEKASLIEGLEFIHLSVTDFAKEAQQLYTQMGFKIWGRESPSLKVGDQYFDEIFMYLKLD
ncbi:MAG: GNAT family N-acetyltransferase [Aureispira sp.]|nr:GNAT family N-acetyltransferase [Aureispira sp.]